MSDDQNSISDPGGRRDYEDACNEARQKQDEELRRQDEERHTSIEQSVAQCRRYASQRVSAKPDWSKWNALSWIAFRDLALLCEIQDENELRRVACCWHASPKAYAAEALLLCALRRGDLPAIRNGVDLPATYWFGRQKVDDDIWLQRDSVLQTWSADPWSVAQITIWGIARDEQQVEDARASGLDQSWAALIIEQRPRNQIEHVVSEIQRLCEEGAIQTYERPRPVTAEEWKNLEIVVTGEGVPIVRWQIAGPDIRSAEPDIRFSAADALRKFPPNVPPQTSEDNAIVKRPIEAEAIDPADHELVVSSEVAQIPTLKKKNLDEKVREALRWAIANDPECKTSGRKQERAAMAILRGNRISGAGKIVKEIIMEDEFTKQRSDIGVTKKTLRKKASTEAQ